MNIDYNARLFENRNHTPEYQAGVNSSTIASRFEQKQAGIQAIILAAGCGSRLGDANKHRPKCLATVNGYRLIDYQLAALSRAGIENVCVVTGYKSEEIRAAMGKRVHYIHNTDWSTTNSLYSLSLCRDWVKHPVVVLNCDVLAHPEVLSRLIEHKCSAITYDSTSGDECEHMKVELTGGLLSAMSKELSPQRTFGENVGILYFSYEASQSLFAHTEHLIGTGGNNLWLASAVERVANHLPLRCIDVYDLPWTEIDFPEDLEQARR